MYNRLVLNIPHASIEGLYDAGKCFWNIDAEFINEVMRWTDWHTDYLFNGLQDERVKTVRFPYSRFIVDAERLWDDPLTSQGRGIIYKHFGEHHRNIPAEAEQPLYALWHTHQQRLRKQLQEGALLLDCHSFPEEMGDVDICIGFNDDWSRPQREVIEMAVNHFEDKGYCVGVNSPYSNSEAPECDFYYHSLMLEVNKRTYLRRGTIEICDDRLRGVISKLMQQLLI